MGTLISQKISQNIRIYNIPCLKGIRNSTDKNWGLYVYRDQIITAMSTTSVSFLKYVYVLFWQKHLQFKIEANHLLVDPVSSILNVPGEVILEHKWLKVRKYYRFYLSQELKVFGNFGVRYFFYNETSNLQFLPLRRSWRRLHIGQQPGWVKLRRGSSETFCKMEIGNLKVENANQD